jgi:hypothetical protein
VVLPFVVPRSHRLIETDTEAGDSVSTTENQKFLDDDDWPVPEDLDAEEYAALAEFEDLKALADQIFSLSDVEDDIAPNDAKRTEPMDDNMDIS